MTTPSPRPRGTGPFYFVAVAATAVSVDTSWRFFGDRLHITNIYERGAMFAVLEMALVACGYAMRHNVRREGGKPGAARTLAWLLCGLAGYMALDLAGATEGLARVALGPVLALVALHLALGIEVRVRRGVNTGAWARIVGEMRERVMSRLGLGDDERKAAERTRDRARDRAARLATATGWTPRRTQRLVKAVRASGATLDPVQRDRLVEQVAVLKNITDLTTIKIASPWAAAVALRHTAPWGTGTPQGVAPAPLQHPTQTPPAVAVAPLAAPVPAPPAQASVNGAGTPIPAPSSGANTPASAPRVNGASTPPAPRPARTIDTLKTTPYGTGTGTPAPFVTSNGTPDGTPTDEELLTVLRDPARVPRESDGTVPIKRAIKALNVGRPRAMRLLDTANLRRYPDPDDGAGTPDGTPAADGSGTGSDDDPERVPAPRINGHSHDLIGAAS